MAKLFKYVQYCTFTAGLLCKVNVMGLYNVKNTPSAYRSINSMYISKHYKLHLINPEIVQNY